MAHSGSTTFNYQAGLGNAASYQVSGIPWVSGNIDAVTGGDSAEISFPSVTQWVVVSNNTLSSLVNIYSFLSSIPLFIL